ncbi:DUF4382 domain-containing protein [Chloroflexota bacterium]
MVKRIFMLVLGLVALLAIGCGESIGPGDGSTPGNGSTTEELGTLILKLTDAPADAEEIAGVYIAINKIEVNKSTSDTADWATVKEYDEPLVYNLLELTGGDFALLGEFELTAGQYNQIRFILDIQEQGKEPPTTPGSYVEFTAESGKDPESLFVPSGGQSGYKAVGAFQVPVNGEVEVTVDFDVRKALHVTGQGNNQRYILKPTLRLVVDSQAGDIGGTVTQDTTYSDVVIFAYEDGDWDISEADDPAEGESRFPNAVTSSKAADDSSYILAYLAYGTYDLVVVGYDGEPFSEVLGIVSDVVLGSNHTALNIDTTNLEEGEGTLVLKLTDAPADAEEIAGVYIAINKIEVNKSTGDTADWTTVREYDESLVYNLLELTGGEFALLGEFELTAGQYNQIRFILDIQEQGKEPPTTPGSYVEFTVESGKDPESLFVPSGGQSGYKAVGAFQVPVNGEVEVTVDFDVRKALHVTGQGNNQRYILKPTLRLVVDSQAGNIGGTVTLDTTYSDVVIFAYEDGGWDISEADDPAEGESRFPNAVTSAKAADDSSYILAYLAYGTYDLVVVGYDGETFGEVLGIVSDVVLGSNHTALNIDTTNLEAI